MKKILVLAVIAVFVMMPLASFAKTAISDSELGAVTGQEGVTIQFDNLTVSGVSLSTVSWGDADGFSGATGAGFVGATNITIPGDFIALSGTMTMDVGTVNGVTKLRVGLPGLVLGGANGMTVEATMKLGSEKTLTAANTGTLGTMYMSGIKATVGGALIIYAH